MESTGQEEQKPERPRQVLYAVYLIYATIAIGILYLIISATIISPGLYSPVFIGCTAIVHVISIWITVKIATGRNWARLFYLAWVILGLLGVIVDLVQNIADDLLLWSLSASSTILGLIVLVLLFKSPSNAWFKQDKKAGQKSSKESIIPQGEEVLVPSGIRHMVEQPKPKKWMIASQLIAGLLLIPWFGLFVFASMIGWPAVIEAEGGWDFLSVTFSLMLFYPLYAIISIAVAWVIYFKRQYRWASIVTSIPLLLSILLFILWVLAA